MQPPPKPGLPPIRWRYVNGTLSPFYPSPTQVGEALKTDDALGTDETFADAPSIRHVLEPPGDLVIHGADPAFRNYSKILPSAPPLMSQPEGSREVHWMVDAGRGSAKGGVVQWAAHAASLGGISGLVGCCGRFSVAANGTWFDEWPEEKYPLSNWDFVHELGITMHFVVTLDQKALLNGTAVLAIPDAVRTAVKYNFTGYAIDYETTPAGGWGSEALAKETDGMLGFATEFAAALTAAGKKLVVDMGGTTTTSLSTQGCSCNQTAACKYQSALLLRWAASGATLMEMGTCK